MLSYEKELAKKPGGEKALLPRYNKLRFSVVGSKDVGLDFYTVKCTREGSVYGASNVEYVSLPVDAGDGVVEAFLFDPFDVGFTDIVADCSYTIDLTSKMRAKYKELSPFHRRIAQYCSGACLLQQRCIEGRRAVAVPQAGPRRRASGLNGKRISVPRRHLDFGNERRCRTARQMRGGPSGWACRSRSQTTGSCFD